MKKFLAISVASAALMLSGASYAQNADGEWYVQETASGEQRIFGGGNPEGAPLLEGVNGAAPADCPEGSFYRTGDNSIAACGEGGAAFDLTAPEAGSMMSSGEAWPEGAMLMRPKESGAQKSSDSVGGETGQTNN